MLMDANFRPGDEVRVLRNIRNDGTFPGKQRGELLVRRGSVGYVRDVGTFLQDQIIYAVHYLDIDFIIGCRQEELQDAEAPWVDSQFESREKVAAKIFLAIQGDVVAEPGTVGEVIKVIRDHPNGVHYHVSFPGKFLVVPETALDPVSLDEEAVDEQLAVENINGLDQAPTSEPARFMV